MIKVENIKKYFPIKEGFFNNKAGHVKAVENVSFEIPEGEKEWDSYWENKEWVE